MILSKPQSQIYRASTDGKTRFIVAVCGRRFGKTVLGVARLIFCAMDEPGRYAYCGPTRVQSKAVAWSLLKASLPPDAVAAIHETELRATLTNGSEIILVGAERADGLRGLKLAGVVVDEYASMKERVWSEVLRPALSDSEGWGWFIGTPMGMNALYDFYLRGIGDPNYPEWRSFQFTTADGGFVSERELETARRELDPRVYAQEYLASFEQLSNRVLYAFDRDLHIKAELAEFKPEHGTVYLAQDYNVDPSAVILAQKHKGLLRIFDEQVLPNSNTPMVAKALVAKVEGYGVTPRSCVVYPDPSGNSRKTSANSGITDHSIMREYGFQVRAMSRAPKIVDRLNHSNAVLLNAADEVRTVVHPRCKSVIRTCEGWTYKTDANGRVVQIPDDSGGLDHVGDAFGYLCCSVFTMPGQGGEVVHDSV